MYKLANNLLFVFFYYFFERELSVGPLKKKFFAFLNFHGSLPLRGLLLKNFFIWGTP